MKKGKPADEYDKAFAQIVARVQELFKDARRDTLPVRMYVAGGAALHLLTGVRVTEDVDATFSTRVLLSEDIEASYRDADGRARVMYLDRNYNDTLGLLHEDAYQDSRPIAVAGIDRKLVDVRVLSPVDLAVSKLARFTDQDRLDIELLASRGLLDAESLRKRAEEALGGYVGDAAPLRTSIDIACRLVDAKRPRRKKNVVRP